MFKNMLILLSISSIIGSAQATPHTRSPLIPLIRCLTYGTKKTIGAAQMPVGISMMAVGGSIQAATQVTGASIMTAATVSQLILQASDYYFGTGNYRKATDAWFDTGRYIFDKNYGLGLVTSGRRAFQCTRKSSSSETIVNDFEKHIIG